MTPRVLEQVLEEGFTGPDEKGEHSQDRDLLLGRLKPQAGNKAFFLVDHHIDGDTDQDLGRDVEQLVDDGTSGGGDDLTAVSAGVLQQAAKGGKAAGGFVAV